GENRPQGRRSHQPGGVATDDAIRSLAISQRLLGTREIILIHRRSSAVGRRRRRQPDRLDPS
ncbi:hypothetical protein ACIQOV_42205, partial [Kitasatospora sp. NPDC091257]